MKNKVIISTIVAALGSFLFGFDTAVISGTTESIEKVFNLDEFWLGFTVASALIGTVIGSLIVGKPGDTYGRKKVLFVVAVFYLVSALGCALVNNWEALLFFRLLGGLAVGAASVISPMYIAEISPAAFRGRLVAVSQFNIVFGILVAFFSNYLIDSSGLFTENSWRWMFGIEAIPAALFFLFLFFIPSSPRWLVKKGRMSEALEALETIGVDDPDSQLLEIEKSLANDSLGNKENLFSKKYGFPVIAAVMLALFNQLSGINALLYYAPKIFKMTGAGDDVALLQSVAIGGTNMIFTIAAMFVIDKFGRKTLLLIGSVGKAICLALVAWAFFTANFEGAFILFCLVGYIAFFAFSQGAVIWVFLSEIFPNSVRANGQALGSFTHWIAAAAISWTFPKMAEESGGYPFAFFSIMMVAQFIFVWKVLPETKGVPLEEIERKFLWKGKEVYSEK